jgi:hypothetical protein
MTYTIFDTSDPARLRISLTDEGRAELQDMRDQQSSAWQTGGDPKPDADIFYELVEYELCNGWDLIAPEAIGALTDNPYLLADTAERDDMGNLVHVGTVYAGHAYDIRSPLDDLEQSGYVDFTGYADAAEAATCDQCGAEHDESYSEYFCSQVCAIQKAPDIYANQEG